MAALSPETDVCRPATEYLHHPRRSMIPDLLGTLDEARRRLRTPKP